jgi:uncharacterized protein YdaU (DUF1376 family)
LNFYAFHIGDYASRTGHLEPMEDLAYRRMLDLYYVREEPLPWDVPEIARLIRLRGQDDVILAVLKEFFVPSEGEGWLHPKCEEVIAAAQKKSGGARASANKRWGKCEGNANAMPTHSEGNAAADPAECEGNAPNPIPNPIPKENPPTPRKRRAAAAQLVSLDQVVAEGVGRQHAEDWLAVRAKKSLLLTPSAWEDVKAEAMKAGMSLADAVKTSASNSWGGFKAKWLTEQGRGGSPQPAGRHTDAAEDTSRMLAERNLKASKPAPEIRARMDAILKGKVYQ